jgi:hypothetical protein
MGLPRGVRPEHTGLFLEGPPRARCAWIQRYFWRYAGCKLRCSHDVLPLPSSFLPCPRECIPCGARVTRGSAGRAGVALPAGPGPRAHPLCRPDRSPAAVLPRAGAVEDPGPRALGARHRGSPAMVACRDRRRGRPLERRRQGPLPGPGREPPHPALHPSRRPLVRQGTPGSSPHWYRFFVYGRHLQRRSGQDCPQEGIDAPGAAPWRGGGRAAGGAPGGGGRSRGVLDGCVGGDGPRADAGAVLTPWGRDCCQFVFESAGDLRRPTMPHPFLEHGAWRSSSSWPGVCWP